MFMPSISGPSITCSGRPPGHDGAVGLLGVLGDELGDAMHQRVRQALAARGLAPFEALAVVLGGALGAFGNFTRRSPASGRRLSTTSSTRARAAGSRSSYTPIMPALTMPMSMPACNGVVQEHGVDGLAHRVVAAEAEGDVGDAARHLGAGQVLLIQRVASMKSTA